MVLGSQHKELHDPVFHSRDFSVLEAYFIPFVCLTVMVTFLVTIAIVLYFSRSNGGDLLAASLGPIQFVFRNSPLGFGFLVGGLLAVLAGLICVFPRIGQLNNHRYRTQMKLETSAEDRSELQDFLEQRQRAMNESSLGEETGESAEIDQND